MKRIKIAQPAAAFLPLQQTTDSPPIQTIKGLVFEPMMIWNNGDCLPGLIQSWSITHHGCQWQLQLRSGATFHDGKPCTADDVIQTLMRIRGAKDSFGMDGPYARYMRNLEFGVLNETEMVVRSPEPTGDLGDIFCEIYIGRENQAGEPIIGTGPYRVTEYQNGVSLHLEAVPGDVRAKVDWLDFYAMPEAEDRLEALKIGRVDVATFLEQLKTIKQDPAFVWKQKAETLSVIYYLNGFSQPFNQLKARIAINHAVNVPAIISDILQGYAIPASTVVSPFHFGFSKDIMPYTYDPKKAKALFSECEMSESLEIRTPTFMPELGVVISERVVAYLQDIGIRAAITVQEDRPQYAREIGYQKEIGSMALFDSSPHSTFRVLRDKISCREQAVWWMGVQDETVADLIEEATSCFQPAGRFNAYARCLRWLHDAPPWLYLFHPIRLAAGNEKMNEMELTHTGILKLID
jgi:peptide/nickel transport system substrate-binding protein